MVKPDRLGDFVLAIGFIRAIIERYGVRNCEIVISKHAREICKMEFPDLVQIVVEEKFDNLYAAKMYLKRLIDIKAFSDGYLLTISLKHRRTPYYDMLLKTIPTSRSIGIENTHFWDQSLGNSKFRFTESVSITFDSSTTSKELAYHKSLLKRILSDAYQDGMETPKIISVPSNCCIVDDGNLIISPFTSDSRRDIAIQFIAQILNKYKSTRIKRITILGPSSEYERLEEYRASLCMLTSKTLEIRTTSSLEEFITILAAGTIILTPETATAHLAIALSKATVALIGGGHYGEFGPWIITKNVFWVTNRLECFNCNWNCVRPQVECLTGISADSVLACLNDAEREVFQSL